MAALERIKLGDTGIEIGVSSAPRILPGWGYRIKPGNELPGYQAGVSLRLGLISRKTNIKWSIIRNAIEEKFAV